MNKVRTRSNILFSSPPGASSLKASLFLIFLLSLCKFAFALIACPVDPHDGPDEGGCFVFCEYPPGECAGKSPEDCPTPDQVTDETHCRFDAEAGSCKNNFRFQCEEYYTQGPFREIVIREESDAPPPVPTQPRSAYLYYRAGHSSPPGYAQLLRKAQQILYAISTRPEIRDTMGAVGVHVGGCCTFADVVSGNIDELRRRAFEDLYIWSSGFAVFPDGFYLDASGNMAASWMYTRARPLSKFEPWYGISLSKSDIPDPRYPEHYPQIATENLILCQEAQRITGGSCYADPSLEGEQFICNNGPTSPECLLKECVCEGRNCSFVTRESNYPCDGVVKKAVPVQP